MVAMLLETAPNTNADNADRVSGEASAVDPAPSPGRPFRSLSLSWSNTVYCKVFQGEESRTEGSKLPSLNGTPHFDRPSSVQNKKIVIKMLVISGYKKWSNSCSLKSKYDLIIAQTRKNYFILRFTHPMGNQKKKLGKGAGRMIPKVPSLFIIIGSW